MYSVFSNSGVIFAWLLGALGLRVGLGALNYGFDREARLNTRLVVARFLFFDLVHIIRGLVRV